MSVTSKTATACCVAALIFAFAAKAQVVDPSAASKPPVACCVVPVGMPVEIELTQLVTSRTAREGDRFAIKLAQDLVVDGTIVAHAGATGMGEVVDAAPGSIGGRPGKLVLAARWVDGGAVRLPLRSFHLAGSGNDSSRSTLLAMTFTPYVGILALGIQGGNIDYPAGTRAMAKVAADTPIATHVDVKPLPALPGATPELTKDKTP